MTKTLKANTLMTTKDIVASATPEPLIPKFMSISNEITSIMRRDIGDIAYHEQWLTANVYCSYAEVADDKDLSPFNDPIAYRRDATVIASFNEIPPAVPVLDVEAWDYCVA